ncbi:hypothetical protein NHX12_018998, partial [Muraenolepis orangiensis]
VLVENAGRWKTDEDPLPLLEVYTVAILSFAKATSCLSSECENVPLLLEKLELSCVELLLLLPQHVPVALWEEFQSSIKLAHSLVQETGNTQLRVLSVMAQQGSVWSNVTLSSILSSGSPQTEQVHEFLELEGPMLLNMRLKHLIKIDSVEKAAVLAKICSEYPGYEGKGNFKQIYLVCICMSKTQEQLMEEITTIDCKDALDMICNLESEGDEKGALGLCTAFLKRQLLQEEVYCAWELTLFWSKLLIRLESSTDVFLEQSKKMTLLCRSVCHILFFIKVIQNEVGEVGLPVCVEMCIQAVKMTTSDHKDSKSTICKTIYCLLPNDLEVKRACQLTEFLLQPTVDSYYSVESLYNEPDQKPEEEGNLPVPNSLRCELLLALKTQWPFDPEFWDWRTLKRNCLALMGEEAAIVSSIDTLNDAEEQEVESALARAPENKDLEDFLLNTTNELNEITDEREKNREAKKLREQGFVSARFRNWRAYMQYCVLCDKEFLGHRIVRHAQKHFKDETHGTHDVVNNPPQSNENPQPPPNIQPIPQGTPKKEDTCSAVVRLKRIDTEAYMKNVATASASPSKSPHNLKEPFPVRVKHSIESMLNSVGNPNFEAKEEKCYTPLTNPAAATVDEKPLPEVLDPQPSVVVEHVEHQPLHAVSCTVNDAGGGPPREGIDNGVTHVLQKVPPQILSPSQIKSENSCPSQGYPSMPAATGTEENMHCCPYKDCTRAYSTNKSLSRHVKKQHPEIFEDWKLAKKYNKVVKIATKKISNMETASPSQSHRSTDPQIPPLCNTPGTQQMDYPVGCSSSPAHCYPGSVDPVPITPMVNPTLYPAWGGPGNSSEVSGNWHSSPMNNCFPDAFNGAEYPSRSYPQWQPDPYQTTTPLPTERDHSLAATHSGTVLHVTSDSTLMSQYVSSSLMLDNGSQIHNGGQQYALMQPDVGVDSDNVRKTNSNMTGLTGHKNLTVESHSDGTQHPPYDQNATPSHPPKITVGVSVEGQTDIPDTQVKDTQAILKATTVIPKVETPGFDPVDSAVEAMLSPQSVITTDIPFEDDLNTVDCEVNPLDEKSSDADAPKGKRNRLSKRTKWPAIIKDGKVICRRCFREFTSTKSLGGHLSKRSQCKPLDEVDLTADLPTSFLDFLNDPHVPDTTNGAIFNVTNGEFKQESSSLTTLTTPQVIKTEPQSSMKDSSSDPLPSASTEQPLQTNGDRKEKAEPTDPFQVVPRREEHFIDISKAFQRLDLIEAAQEKLKMEKMSFAQHVVKSDSISDSEKGKTLKEKRDEKSREKLPKPFKCDQDDCEYSFMTKEALFKHLSKMHDYTNDMIEELKRTPVNFSPYPCQICPKTFTRTTGLRIHYEKVHRLTKPEMLKLKFSARNRRVFRLAKEDCYSSRTATEANTSRTTTSLLPIFDIKQEPLDIAIETQTDHNDNPMMVTTAYDSAEEGLACEISTVTKLPSPHHYLSDGQNCEMSSSMPAQEEPGETQANPRIPEFNDELGEVSIVPNHHVPSDKPSGSKASPTSEYHKREKPQKKLGLKMGDLDAFSPYRPYRCVHEGCTAAFTIQQNLILHYRAMHQASMPLTRAGDTETPSIISGQESVVQDDEVRCQVKDCSRVFTGITKLVQHYLLLHKFTRDKATAMMSSMNVRAFECDREECSLPFESVDKYIEHIKNVHKEIAISESGSVDTTYKCEYDGCDCVYTTKSNLLRHLIKKHEYVYDPKSSDGRRTKSVGLFCSGNSEKENFESKYKVKKKNMKKKEVKSMDHWSSFGKPALKSHEEASALCIKKSSLQYPCMIIGCDMVERAERSIFKHYTTHGLTERYIEDHRSQFIFCKKYSRSRFKDANKSEGMSTSSSSEVSEADESEREDGKPNGPNSEDRIAQDYGKLSTDESSESQASTVAEGNRKVRPRKPAHPTPACSERMQTLRNRLTVSSSRENSNPGTPSAQEEQSDDGLLPGSYKPLELESFLPFLDASESTQASKRKLSDRAGVELPAKRQPTIRQKSTQRGKLSDELSDCANLVDFRNPLNLNLGCFVFKPSAKKRRKTCDLAEYFSRGCDGSEMNSTLRYKLCQELWDTIKADTENLQDELNRNILDGLLQFIRKCCSTFQRNTDDWVSRMRASEIPTAALVLGVNVPDHDMTFQSLCEQLQQSVTPHVALLQAKECGALRNIMQRVLERLMAGQYPTPPTGAHCTLATLSEWYENKTRKSNTPGKKRSSGNGDEPQRPPIVIIFKDLEAFNPRVLQDFILICSRYVEQLPLMFVFGIATSPSTIQHVLPHSVSSLLCIELFQSLSCTQHLATVIDKLILTHYFPFKPNGKVLQVLVSIFLYHDFSVRNFIKGLKLALLEHFLSQPLSILCGVKTKDVLGNITQLGHQGLESVRQLASFRRYVEQQKPQEQVDLLTNDEHMKETCKKLLKGLHKYHKNYYPVLRCLHTLTNWLPKYPLGKQIRELHIMCLEGNVWEKEEYQSAMQLLRMLAKEELTLLEMKETRRTKKMTPFEILRNEVLEFIDGLVRSHLPAPETQPLYEVCYYGSSAVLRRHLNAAPRTSIQTALSSPFHYLKNDKLLTADGGVSNAAPDVCIVHKLHLECGRLINLYDWLEAYATVVSAAEGKDPESEDYGKVDELKHARFIQAVSELEFLGFIKSTKQKTDHVARLTWGGC